eukprot:gene1678-3249_t
MKLLKILLIVRTIYDVHAESTLIISQPQNFGVYAVRPPSQTTGVDIHFHIEGNTAHSGFDVCFELKDTNNNNELLPYTCVSANESVLQLSGISTGKYELAAILQHIGSHGDKIHTSKQITTFSVVHMSDLLPALRLTSSNKITPYNKNITDVEVEYQVEDSVLSLELEPCMRVLDMNTNEQEVVKLTCFQELKKSLILFNMNRGKYKITLLLRLKEPPFSIFTNSEIFTNIAVLSIQEALPRIAIAEPIYELGIPKGKHVVELHVLFEVLGYSSAIIQLQPCVTVKQIHFNQHIDTNNSSSSSSSGDILPLTCLDSLQRTVSFNSISEGDYMLYITLRQIHHDAAIDPTVTTTTTGSIATPVIYDSTTVYVSVIVKHLMEFVPGYEWRPLHGWHTIPLGIITRLPLSSVSHKEAKIAEPWRLQVALPLPCKYFLRTDVFRHTNVRELREIAGKQCKQSHKGCFRFYIDDLEVIDEDSTVEALGLFNKHLVVEYGSSSADNDLCQ